VAPAIYGGIQLGIHTGERWTTERVNTPPGIQLVLFIPDFIGKTSDARAVLEVRGTVLCALPPSSRTYLSN
jgi:homoserine kinase